MSDSPELQCVGCYTKSKSQCPVDRKKKGEQHGKGGKRVMWGKTASRKLKTRSGRRVRVLRRCGDWCRLCYNNVKRTIKKSKKYKAVKAKNKKDGQRAATKQLKQDLEDDAKFSKRWQEEIDESAHLLAGGRSRLRGSTKRVETAEEHMHDIVDRGMQFYVLDVYKEKIGDPKDTGAKIVTRCTKAGKKVRGVYVRKVGTEGIFDVEDRVRLRASVTTTKLSGNDILHGDEVSEAEAEAEEELEDKADARNVLTVEESKKRAQSAQAAREVAAAASVKQESDSDTEKRRASDDEGSSSNDSSSSGVSSNSKAAVRSSKVAKRRASKPATSPAAKVGGNSLFSNSKARRKHQ